ncbi:MAG: hypothetical protein PUA64_01970 [Treponema sp.]|nr:hypothetical protein [Treponema sp.]
MKKNKPLYEFFTAILLLLSLLFFSCATQADFDFSNIDSAIAKNDFPAVYNELESKSNKLYGKHDEVLEFLDKGIVSHYSKNYKDSNEELSYAEKKIEEYYTVSISQTISSFLVNDTVKDYQGEIYENIYSNIFMALNYLHQNEFDESMVEIRRFDIKLKELSLKYQQRIESAKQEMKNGSSSVPDSKLKFHNSAFARYLSMLLYRTDGDVDNAAVDLKLLRQAFSLQPEIYNFPVPKNLNEDINIPEEKARLNVIAFSGIAPIKQEKTLQIPLNSTYYKIALPEMTKRPSSVASIKLHVSSKTSNWNTTKNVEKLESIENIAIDTFKQHYTMIFIKELSRSITKATTTGILSEQADRLAGASSIFLNIMSLTSALTTEFTERADVRTTRYFPANVSVAGITLDPGVYDIKIEYLNASGHILASQEISDYQVQLGKLNLIEDIFLR